MQGKHGIGVAGFLVSVLGALLFLFCGCCEPDCKGKCCGDDGCGGVCSNTCPSPARICCDAASCECVLCIFPQCEGRCCGDDGIGGECPDDCPQGYQCDDKACVCEVEDCVQDADCIPGKCCVDGACWWPQCNSLRCGPDPLCGFSCGTCEWGLVCNEYGICEDFTGPVGTGSTIPGMCGMEGRCVGCNFDDDCEEYERCEVNGWCYPDYYNANCHSDADCPAGYVCRMGMCLVPCWSDMDCWYGRVCVDEMCIYICDADIDCEYGERCISGECRMERCQPEGVCPQDWEPVDGSLACRYNPCPEPGTIVGACGLYPQCVECFLDSHCPGGICDLVGQCVDPECGSDGDCPVGGVCVDGRCGMLCLADEDCGSTETCEGSPGACRVVRCDEEGKCPKEKWQPVPGSLACQFDLCPQDSLVPGVCAFQDRCVECVSGGDCQPGMFCSLRGRCYELPQCRRDYNCEYGETCLGGVCVIPCTVDADCYSGAGICLQEGYCFFERCASDGTCPDGWEPGKADSVPDTLACIKN